LKLPNAERAEIPEHKIVGYLLSEVHPIGRWKAEFFRSLGYTPDAPDIFRRDLLELAKKAEVSDRMTTAYGTKYVVDGYLRAETAAPVMVRTIWIASREGAPPRLVTAYPV
jgi:hypothetical protein